MKVRTRILTLLMEMAECAQCGSFYPLYSMSHVKGSTYLRCAVCNRARKGRARNRRLISLEDKVSTLMRYGARCMACGSFEELTIDHVVPIMAGGNNHVENYQILCIVCNIKKGHRTIDYRKGIADHLRRYGAGGTITQKDPLRRGKPFQNIIVEFPASGGIGQDTTRRIAHRSKTKTHKRPYGRRPLFEDLKNPK